MKKKNKFKIFGDYSIIYVKRCNEELEVKVDTEDLKKIIDVGGWHAILDMTLHKYGYYICHRYNNKVLGSGCIKLHRFITDCPREKEVDHINNDTLDNRKCNLRIVTHFENQQNLRSNKSGIIGVHQRANGNWVGKISKNNKVYQKEFKKKEDAIMYRKQMYDILYKGGDE